MALASLRNACWEAEGRLCLSALLPVTPGGAGVTRPARERAALKNRKQGGCRGCRGLVSPGHPPDPAPLGDGGRAIGREVALEKEEEASVRTGLQGTVGALCDHRTHDGPARGTRRTLGSEASFRCSGRTSLSELLPASEPSEPLLL